MEVHLPVGLLVHVDADASPAVYLGIFEMKMIEIDYSSISLLVVGLNAH